MFSVVMAAPRGTLGSICACMSMTGMVMLQESTSPLIRAAHCAMKPAPLPVSGEDVRDLCFSQARIGLIEGRQGIMNKVFFRPLIRESVTRAAGFFPH